MLASLGKTAALALWQHVRPNDTPPACPGAWIEAEPSAPPRALAHDFVREVGGEPSVLRDHLPPHLFPQWGLPLAARALSGVPYPMLHVMNAGCQLRILARLPAGERLQIRARLESVDETETRAVLRTRILTGTKSTPDALDATLHAFVPLARRAGGSKSPTAVPRDAREIERIALDPRAGLRFALLTGDFNPIHWLAPYARSAGFRAPILHGFGTFARVVQVAADHMAGRDPYRLTQIEARFTKPLVLPARVGVFVEDERLYVGDAAGSEAYLTGSFEARS